MTAGDALSLEVPAHRAHIGTARTFVAAAARHFGVHGEGVEDLKLAVSEACSEAAEAQGTGSVRLRLSHSAGGLALEVESPASFAGASPGPDGEPGWSRLELIRTLFPDAAVAPAGRDRFLLTLSLTLG